MKTSLRSFAAIFAFFSALLTLSAAEAQPKVFYVPDAGGATTPMYRITFPNSTKSTLFAAAISAVAVDPATAVPFYAAGGSVHARTKKGLRPIVLYANVNEGLAVDSGLRSIVFIGGSAIRTLYIMGFNPKPNGQLPNPRALVSFSDSVTARSVSTLDSQYAFWSQDNENGTSSIYRVNLKGTPKVELVHTQTDGDEGGRPITAVTVDSFNQVLYFCQQGSTSVIKALNLNQTGPTTFTTFNGQCRSLAVDGLIGRLFVADTPNGSDDGLVAFKTTDAGDSFRFEAGQSIASVSVQPMRQVQSSTMKPLPPVIDMIDGTASIYMEKFFSGLVGYQYSLTLTYPNHTKKTFDDGPLLKFSSLPKGSYSVRYRLNVFSGNGKGVFTNFSKSRSFKIE